MIDKEIIEHLLAEGNSPVHIDEMLRSVPIGKVDGTVSRWFGSLKFVNKDTHFSITTKFPNNEWDDAVKWMSNMGWVPSWYIAKDGTNPIKYDKAPLEGVYEVTFEPTKPYTPTARNTLSVLYHATPTRRVEKIKNIGLCPKSSSKAAGYPSRIYLAKSEVDAENIAKQLNKYNKAGQWSILKIFVPAGLELFDDPQFKQGYFTYNNIPSYSIKVVKEIHV